MADEMLRVGSFVIVGSVQDALGAHVAKVRAIHAPICDNVTFSVDSVLWTTVDEHVYIELEGRKGVSGAHVRPFDLTLSDWSAGRVMSTLEIYGEHDIAYILADLMTFAERVGGDFESALKRGRLWAKGRERTSHLPLPVEEGDDDDIDRAMRGADVRPEHYLVGTSLSG